MERTSEFFNSLPNYVDYVRVAFDATWTLEMAEIFHYVDLGTFEYRLKRAETDRGFAQAEAALEYNRWKFKQGIRSNPVRGFTPIYTGMVLD